MNAFDPGMNDECAIRVQGLTKAYKLYRRHSDRVKETFNPFRKKYHYQFLALKDVSLEVRRGETVGIIGRNGSGKSTLLQLICGVVQPTAGRVRVSGRISAILELGAGFNHEFTGRQNVYLCGRILGLSKEEIDARFKEIVAFADVGDFIDQPVKAYSSGMVVRLAFAIAGNVSPDVMVVDEALAVGDEAFQRKCFGRIQAVKKAGATILFVSHEAGVVVELCDRAYLLDQGEVILEGDPKRVVARYHKLLFAPRDRVAELREAFKAERATGAALEGREAPSTPDKESLSSPEGTGPTDGYDPGLVSKSCMSYDSRGAEIMDAAIVNESGQRVNVLVRGRAYRYTYRILFRKAAFQVRWGAMIKTLVGYELGGLKSHPDGSGLDFVGAGKVIKASFRFRSSLMPGVYFWNSGVTGYQGGQETFLHRVVDILMFRVQPERSLTVAGVVDFTADGGWEYVVEDVEGAEGACMSS